ncbi:MAG: hypothetical protein ACKO45_12710 [Cyanobium sp.]
MALPPSLFAESGQQFCNADSFAMAFDDALHLQAPQGAFQALNRAETLELILSQLTHHPFAQIDAARAREVGEFRLRLHGV